MTARRYRFSYTGMGLPLPGASTPADPCCTCCEMLFLAPERDAAIRSVQNRRFMHHGFGCRLSHDEVRASGPCWS
eukprot:1274525-Prymnesium_polylepis.1